MKTLLLALIPKLVGLTLSASHPVTVRASTAADHIAAALAAEGVPEAARAAWSYRAFVMAYYESSWTVSALGDGGAACGYLQVTTPEKWLKGATCASVRTDGVAGMRVGIAVMRMLIDRCGSVKAGLTAYATDGACHPWVAKEIVRRCAMVPEAC